jgi:hypothetical protein
VNKKKQKNFDFLKHLAAPMPSPKPGSPSINNIGPSGDPFPPSKAIRTLACVAVQHSHMQSSQWMQFLNTI